MYRMCYDILFIKYGVKWGFDFLMYESYTRQALPNKNYRELLGSAICVFNANNAFIVENILRNDCEQCYTWHNLIDLTSGQLKKSIQATITENAGLEIPTLFEDLVNRRNRIIHNFQFTDLDGEQRLATKEKSGNQFTITEEYLLDFINDNQR